MSSNEKERTPPTRGRRWMVRIGILSAMLALLLAFLPTIVSTLHLLGPILNGTAMPSGMRVRIETAQLSWLEPVEATGVVLDGEDGSIVAQSKIVRTELPLWRLCASPMQLGKVIVQSPVCTVKLPAGSASSESPSSLSSPADFDWQGSAISFVVEVVDGEVVLEDPNQQPIAFHHVQASLDVNQTRDDSLRGKVQADVAQGQAVGQLEGEWEMSPATSGRPKGRVLARNCPVCPLNWVMGESLGTRLVNGTATGEFQLEPTVDSAGVRIVGKGKIIGLDADVESIKPDRISWKEVSLAIDAEATPEAISLKQADIDNDWARIRATGSFSTDRWVESIDKTLQVEGVVDLATVARDLPHTIRVRDGVSVERGQLAVSIKPSSQTHQMDAMLEVRDLRAVKDGEAIEWSKPVLVTAKVESPADGDVKVQDLRVESDFLRAKGSGTATEFDVTAVCDLGALESRLGRFLELNETKLAGRVTARLQTQRQTNDRVHLRGAARAEALTVKITGRTFVAEDLINAQLQFISSSPALDRFESGAIVVKTATDSLQAQLRSSVADWNNGHWGTWDVEATGSLANVPARIQTVLGEPFPYQMAGQGSLTGRVTWEGSEITLESMRWESSDVVITGDDIRIVEPKIEITTAGIVDYGRPRLALVHTQVRSSSTRADLGTIEGAMASGVWELTGKGVLSTDLSVVRRWMLVNGEEVDLAGQLRGQAAWTSRAGEYRFQIRGEVSDARYGTLVNPVVSEPRLDVAIAGATQAQDQSIAFQELRLAMTGLSMEASGKMRSEKAGSAIDLEGQLQYDWAALSPKVKSLLGDGFHFEGADRQPFKLEGTWSEGGSLTLASAESPPRSAEGAILGLQGSGAVGWQRARIYGFEAGPALFKSRLKENWLVAQPTSFDLSGGKAQVSPGIYFAKHATYLHHPASVVAQDVALTQQMCEGGLQYIAPVLARAVDVKGFATVELGEVKIALGQMDKADFSGKLRLRQVQVTGNPLVEDLFLLSEKKTSLDLIEDAEIPFRIADGRVYHENLRLRLPGFQVVTSGSVGFDRSVALMAEMPVPPRWIPGDQLREDLKDLTIKVPIGGTLDRPRLDQRVLQEEIGKILGQAAGKKLKNEVNREIDKQLNKLLDKLR